MEKRAETKITDSKQAFALFALCWTAYFACYIGRLNYSSAMAAMIQEQVLTKTQAGTVGMVYFFAYGTGQLLNGFLGDKLRPGRMIFTGLFASMLCNFAMGFAVFYGMMALVWGINGYAQAMVWPPILRLFATRLQKEKRLRYSVDIVSSQAVGTLASYILTAGILTVSRWQTVFWAAGGFLLAVSILWVVGYACIQRASSAVSGVPTSDGEEAPPQKASNQANVRMTALLRAGLWMSVLPAIAHGALKDGVTSWVPTYISETFHTSATLSVLVTAVLPVVNLSGAYAAKMLYRRYDGHEVRAAAVFFGISTAALAVLRAAGGASLVLTTALLAVITSCMIGVNTLLISLAPLRYEKQGRVSGVSGFLNACAYLGTALSTFTTGIMVEQLGWNVTVFSWLAVAALAAAACFTVRRLYSEQFLKKPDGQREK